MNQKRNLNGHQKMIHRRVHCFRLSAKVMKHSGLMTLKAVDCCSLKDLTSAEVNLPAGYCFLGACNLALLTSLAVVKCFWTGDYIALAVAMTACFHQTLEEEYSAADCRAADGSAQPAAGGVAPAVEQPAVV